MYTVRVTTANNGDSMLRQLPGSQPVSLCGKYRFVFDNGKDDLPEADFWIVRNKYIKRPTKCRVAPENTILMLSEPYSVLNFPKRYRDQFGLVCSCQDQVKHRNVIYRQAALPWFVGVGDLNSSGSVSLSYDTLINAPLPEKTKMLSVISSNKAFTFGHKARIDFVKKLQQRYGDRIDYYGRGSNGFKDKWDVLAPYKYHIAIENSQSPYYWTEKLSDCYLAGTFPIYYGCTNISDFLRANAYQTIDIKDPEASFKVIDNILDNDPYESLKETLTATRTQILNDYNIFTLMADCCNQLDPMATKKEVTLNKAITMLDWHNLYLQVIERNLCKF